MRILLTTDTIGGVWTFTLELSRGLLNSGHAVALVSFGSSPTPAQAATIEALSQSFPGFEYTSSNAPLEWMEQNERAWQEGSNVIARRVSDFTPDILHANQFCFGRFGAFLPVLITAHSDVLSWAESVLASSGGIAELERTACPDWLNTYRQLVGEGLARATNVVAPTSWMARELTRIYDCVPTPQVISNGIATRTIDHVTRSLQAITAGRLWDQAKGLAILSGIERPFPISVAGEQFSSPLPDDISWLGPLPHQELLRLFAQSAIYLATSSYEPFGLAPLEAAQCGCAIVARDIPSFRETWGDAALYFKSAATLQELLTSLASNPIRLEAAQRRSSQRAALYDAQTMTQQYLLAYEGLLVRSSRFHERGLAYA